VSQADYPRTSALDRAISWTSLLTLGITAVSFAWYVPRSRQATMAIYGDFKTTGVPPSMAFVCAVPTGLIIAVAVIAVVLAVVVQIRAGSKRSASLFHLLLTVMFGVTFLAYREAMGTALLSLMQKSF
jgi:hypothetical protein